MLHKVKREDSSEGVSETHAANVASLHHEIAELKEDVERKFKASLKAQLDDMKKKHHKEISKMQTVMQNIKRQMMSRIYDQKRSESSLTILEKHIKIIENKLMNRLKTESSNMVYEDTTVSDSSDTDSD